MLGHHRVLERDLRRRGRRALARIIDAERTHLTQTPGGDAAAAEARRLWKLVLQVEPQGEAPFEAEVAELFGQRAVLTPTADFALAVLYDPHDRARVLVDRSEDGDRLFLELLLRRRAGGDQTTAAA